MKKRILFIAFSLSTLMAVAMPGKNSLKSTPQEMDKFVTELMKKMTIEEKIGQLNLPVTGEITTGQARNSGVARQIEQGLVGGVLNLKGVDKIREVQKLAVENSRLGIPLLFGMDVVHGYETIFPIPLGLSCSWNLAAIQESARIAAVEASADGICWTFSPMVDISRDPRWGRVSEGNGEDPFLGGAIARAMVLGYQGANNGQQLQRDDEIMACVKHFALYGAGEAGRDYNTVDMSRNRMFNEYLYPYQAAVEAGAGSVMASFNEVDGIPATANHWLMTDVLRRQWNFNGFVVTDFTGISVLRGNTSGMIFQSPLLLTRKKKAVRIPFLPLCITKRIVLTMSFPTHFTRKRRIVIRSFPTLLTKRRRNASAVLLINNRLKLIQSQKAG